MFFQKNAAPQRWGGKRSFRNFKADHGNGQIVEINAHGIAAGFHRDLGNGQLTVLIAVIIPERFPVHSFCGGQRGQNVNPPQLGHR